MALHRVYIVGNVGAYYGARTVRLYRTDTKAVKDVSLKDLAEVADRLDIGNYDDFVTGNFSRDLYPLYGRSRPGVLSGNDTCYVIGATSGGYVVLRPHVGADFIRVIPHSRLVSDVKKGRVRCINGVVEQINGVDCISPLSGEWDDATSLSGRHLADANVAEQEAREAGDDYRSGVAAHDELGALSSVRRDFLRDYYIGYSAEMFARISNKSDWKLKGAKLEKLVALRGLSGEERWRFAGMWDGGFVGAETCELGHKLRYVYLACPVNVSFAQARDDGTLLKFGIVCHTDFLDIPREDVARLSKLQDTMCDEIAFLSSAAANREDHSGLMSSMIAVLKRLRERGMLVGIVGERLSTAADGFEASGLSLPESFVLDIRAKFAEYGVRNVLEAIGIDTSDFYTEAEPLYTLPTLSADASESEKRNFAAKERNAHIRCLNNIYLAVESYSVALTRYANMLFDNDICGEYAYDPCNDLTTFRKRGAEKYRRCDADGRALKYNDRTRDLRSVWLKYFQKQLFVRDYTVNVVGGKAQCLSLDAFERALALVRRLRRAAASVSGAWGDAGLRAAAETIVGFKRGLSPSERQRGAQLLIAVLPVEMGITNAEMLQMRRIVLRVNDICEQVEAVLDETRDGSDTQYLEQALGLALDSSPNLETRRRA
jgi:hypothetical protein